VFSALTNDTAMAIAVITIINNNVVSIPLSKIP
jgi:hypothetical protein